MCCKKSCWNGIHCWHSYHGPWYGINRPEARCCQCGIYESQLHGPYRPHGYDSTTITVTLKPANWSPIYQNSLIEKSVQIAGKYRCP